MSCLVLACVCMSGCNSWLDIEPEGVQTEGTFWQTKEEAEQVLFSSYLQLRTCMPLFFKWGEIKGDGIAFGPAHGSASDAVTEEERNMRMMDIRPSSSLVKWKDVYTAIGRANTVIYFVPTALKNDATFAPELATSYIAEAIFIRSLCYFYLVRTFRDVPLVLVPYADDSKDFATSTTDATEIIDVLIADLEAYKFKCKPGYEKEWQQKGRATSWACIALLADIYLWRGHDGDYEKVVELCKLFEKSPYMLMPREEWMKIYSPGNSAEGIFELQYRGGLSGQKNNLYDWFWGTTDARYVVSDVTREIFESNATGDVDVRGYTSGYGENSDGRLWKYVGTKNTEDKFTELRPSNDRSANWIFYRYADVLLMQAEALVMLNRIEDACTLLDQTVRKRAGYTEGVEIPASQLTALELVADERQREFVAEGKRWFDMLRIARRNDYQYRTYLVEHLLPNVPAKERQTWKIRLNDENSHYLPIHKDEIVAGRGVLKQNPFYENVD